MKFSQKGSQACIHAVATPIPEQVCMGSVSWCEYNELSAKVVMYKCVFTHTLNSSTQDRLWAGLSEFLLKLWIDCTIPFLDLRMQACKMFAFYYFVLVPKLMR